MYSPWAHNDKTNDYKTYNNAGAEKTGDGLKEEESKRRTMTTMATETDENCEFVNMSWT